MLQISQSTAVVNGTVQLVPGVVKPFCHQKTNCAKYQYANSSIVRIEAPVKVVLPAAVISTTKLVVSCDSITLDPTYSRGNGDRDWDIVEWSTEGDVGFYYRM